MDLEQLFSQYKEQSIEGRYLTLDSIQPLLKKINTSNNVKIIGKICTWGIDLSIPNWKWEN